MGSEVINQDRRQLLSTAAMGIAAAGAASILPRQDLIDLHRSLAATRWPDKETVADDSQGVPPAMLQELVRYWQTDYDWRKVEVQLNALPQSITEIDELDIHFIHVRSKHENTLPDKGGHFAAWEQPQVFSEEVRAAFRPLRS
jgi:pimeloyl-ACP methyl ester carboxylesterase